jgi:outer membrane immunogenic protein
MTSLNVKAGRVALAAGLAGTMALSSLPVLADGMPPQPYQRYAPPRYNSVKDAPPQDSFSWTGFYVGGNVGASWTDSSAKFANVPVPIVGGGDGNYALDETGIVGGLHAGYGLQISQVVVGVEGDMSFLGGSKSSRAVAINQVMFPGFSETVSSETNWIGTLRGRLGWAYNSFLFYATGGLAWGDVKARFDANQAGVSSAWYSTSNIEQGWALGGGVEWAVTNNVIVRGEFMHIDLGSTTLNTPVNGTSFATSTRFDNRFNILRAGVSYKF